MDSLKKIKKPLSGHLAEFNKVFRTSVKSNTALLDIIMQYILKTRGKQMRPIIVLYSAGLIAAKEMHTAGFLAVYWALAIYAAATAREALKAHPPGVGLFFNAAGLAFAWLVTQFAAVPLLLALFGLVGGPACVASLHVPPPPQGLGSCRFFDGFSVCIDMLGYIGRFAALVAAYIHWSWLIGDNSTGG